MTGLIQPADVARLRTFWNERYREFTLSESGWFGGGEPLNDRIYACKARALSLALSELNRRRTDRFRVLDAGCGQGYFARFYRDRYPLASYTGLDLSERVVEHLRATLPCRSFHVGDLAAWSDPAGGRFDVIQGLEVLHLILDDERFTLALQNLARQLSHDGALLVTAARPEDTQQPSSYLRYRSRQVWTDTLDSIGLRVVRERPIYYWLPAGGPANKYLRYALAHLGAGVLYAADRAALAIGLPRPRSLGIDCRMRLLTLQRGPK